jgi:YbgC/YbaW family acyl-CoA thioester hydrolase
MSNSNSIKFEYEVQILERHLDSFGHVNNATYLELYEEARWDFITKGGYGLNTIQKEKKGPIVLETTVKFRKEIKNREKIRIISQATEIKGKIMKMHQMILNEKDEISSEAFFTFGFMDLKERKLISPTDMWLKAIGHK